MARELLYDVGNAAVPPRNEAINSQTAGGRVETDVDVLSDGCAPW